MTAMTAGATALSRPQRRPGSEPRRHLEVAPSRAQRRARPRLVHAVVTLAGVVGILLAQLGLSIVLAEGAYRISSLQVEQRELLRQHEALSEQLESLQSPQFLAGNAERLGMVASGSLPYIDLETGRITGTAGEVGQSMLGGSGNLIGNATLDGLAPLVEVSHTEQTAGAAIGDTDPGDAPGAATGSAGEPEVPSGPGTLPSPSTR